MYMNEQLFQRPVSSKPSTRTVLRNSVNSGITRFFGLLAAIALVLTVSLCAPMLGGDQDALAASNNTNAKQTVEVEKGDTLWSIAGQHVRKGQDVREYINEMKVLNSLKSNVLQEGQLLQLP